MKLIVGLGNPGSQYEHTRHNAGFMLLDKLAAAGPAGPASWQAAHLGLATKLSLGSEACLLLKPLTFMNLSGRSVADAMRFYRLTMGDLLVVVDDVALPCGTIRLRAGGSSGGHNGLADIERLLESIAAGEGDGKAGRDYARLRIGVDAPGREPLEAYVLGRFSPAQQPLLQEALTRGAEAVQYWACAGAPAAMARYNGSASGKDAKEAK